MCKYSHPYYDCVFNCIIKLGFNQIRVWYYISSAYSLYKYSNRDNYYHKYSIIY